MLNAQTRMMPTGRRRVANANNARIAVVRSPYAAGPANAIGKSEETTPGTTNANPTKRKLCKRRMGRSASARGWLPRAGQMYSYVTIPQTTKLNTTLIPNTN
jgi:hypothetical protein